ncbi:hypothetical protein HQ524_02630 [Candidatus Uhrbacteria bacterium]|nr:hypothetical protein [Candidatus Uhrbacteria bacterium]
MPDGPSLHSGPEEFLAELKTGWFVLNQTGAMLRRVTFDGDPFGWMALELRGDAEEVGYKDAAPRDVRTLGLFDSGRFKFHYHGCEVEVAISVVGALVSLFFVVRKAGEVLLQIICPDAFEKQRWRLV